MVAAALLFATMGVCIKFASATYSALEIVFYRGLVGVVFLYAIARARGVSLRSPVPGMHAWRSVVGVISLVGWFHAISVLPLATAMTLNYMSSVWIAAFLLGGALLMQQRQMAFVQQAPLFLTVIIGFVGVALVLRPTLDSNQAIGGLVGLMSGLFAALAYLQVSALSRAGEPETRTVFYFSLSAAVAGGLGTLGTDAHGWDNPHAWLLLPIGILAALGQLCMTRAYASGSTMLVANLQFSGIVFAGLYGVLVFGDRLPWFGWAGMALIIASGVAATALRSHAIPQAPAEEHS